MPLTFEEVDKKIGSLTTKMSLKVTSKDKSATKDNAIQTLLKIWDGGAKAVITFTIPFLPKKWRDVVSKLIQVIDIIVAKEEPFTFSEE